MAEEGVPRAPTPTRAGAYAVIHERLRGVDAAATAAHSGSAGERPLTRISLCGPQRVKTNESVKARGACVWLHILM